jgi:hypothetical protein
MLGKISSIKLINEDDKSYWSITIIDENGFEIGTFGDCEKSDSINFRKQTFGILKVCECIDLLSIGGNKIEIPIFVDSSITRVNAVSNENGEYLAIDRDANMELGFEYDISKCEKQKITTLESSSGVISAKLMGNWSMQYFQAPMAYRGFKEIYDFPVSDEDEKKGADYFQCFVTQILNIGKINELIPDKSKMPVVSVNMDETGKITAIGNANGEIWLVDENAYSISKTPPLSNSKVVK